MEQNRDYIVKMEFIVRTHDDKKIYRNFYEYGHEILDDSTVTSILRCIDHQLKQEKEV